MIIISDTFRLAVHARWQMKEDERLDEEEEEDDDDGYLIFFFFFFFPDRSQQDADADTTCQPDIINHVVIIIAVPIHFLF